LYLGLSCVSFCNAHQVEPGLPPLIIAGVKFPPLATISEDGNISGPVIDTLNGLFDQLEHPYQWIGVSQNRLYREIEAGTIDLTVVTKKNNALDQQLFFSQQPFSCVHISVFSAPDLPAITSLTDLSGRTVLYYYYFEQERLSKQLTQIPDIHLFSVDNRSSAITMLEAGRAGYYLDFAAPVEKVLAVKNSSLASKTIHIQAGYLAAPKQRAGAQTLIHKIDQLLSDYVFDLNVPGADSEAFKCGWQLGSP